MTVTKEHIKHAHVIDKLLREFPYLTRKEIIEKTRRRADFTDRVLVMMVVNTWACICYHPCTLEPMFAPPSIIKRDYFAAEFITKQSR
jgi:hypothetical protein